MNLVEPGLAHTIKLVSRSGYAIVFRVTLGIPLNPE